MLHAAILRSPIAHGRIRRIGLESALRVPGVAALLTARDIADGLGRVPVTPIRLCPLPELEPFAQPTIAAEIVRFVGEPVAVVLAESRAVAEDAADAVELDIEPVRDAPPLRRRAGRRRDNLPRNEGRRGRGVRGGALHAARKPFRSAPLGGADGAARAAGGMGRRASHRLRRGKGVLCGAPRARRSAGARRGHHRDGGERRRRRVRTARGGLSRGFPDPLRRLASRPVGQVDRGSARAPDRRGPCPRGALRHRNRVR